MSRKLCALWLGVLALTVMVSAQQSPDEFFKTRVGADRTLVIYPDIVRYFDYLGTESARVRVSREGESTLGRPMILAAVSSADNIARLDELIDINRRLADPDRLTARERTDLVHRARVFVLITAAIHATEIASTQMVMKFAHELATSDDPGMKSTLDNVVVLLMPSINPDGNVMVTEWYRKYVGTEYEGSRMPYLYHHYAGHDNNRDFYMLNLKESRVVNAVLHHRYFPHVFLDMHQMGSTGPRMFVPPFNDPLNSNLDPVLVRETGLVGAYMAMKLQEADKSGVASAYAFDAYWPGGSKNTAWFKNVVGLLTEMASARVATPVFVESNELQAGSKGLVDYKPQVNFPDPWAGGWWHLNDIIQYEMIADQALVEIAGRNREALVSNFCRLGEQNVRKGRREAPFAWVIPHEQWDRSATTTFLRIMQENGIRLSRITADGMCGRHAVQSGDWIISLAQPYRSFIQVMMERQQYPEIRTFENGPIIEPYDATGWTLPLQMGVDAVALDHPLDNLQYQSVGTLKQEDGHLTGTGPWCRLPARANRSWIVVNRLLAGGQEVFRATANDEVSPGDFLVRAESLDTAGWSAVLSGSGVSAIRTPAPPPDTLTRFRPFRVGLYQSYRANTDEGWTRFVLDQFEFPYTVLHNPDFASGPLADRIDVLIIPDQSRSIIVDGVSRPGQPDESQRELPPEYRGGIGKEGMKAIKEFVRKGGTLVLLDSAWEVAGRDFDLPLVNVLDRVGRDRFYCPGSILRLDVDPHDPLGWGMPEKSMIFFARSPAFRTRVPDSPLIDRRVVAGFGAERPHLLSGYLKGGDLLDRTAMIIRFRYHDGNVVVLGGRVQHRAQTHATFKFLFNALGLAGLEKLQP